MSWLQKLLPPKIKRDTGSPKKVVPEGLWSKCTACEAVLYRTDLEKNLFVCPKCGHHDRLSARERLDALQRAHVGRDTLTPTLRLLDGQRRAEAPWMSPSLYVFVADTPLRRRPITPADD